jgi:hypothetical protein
MKKRKFQEGGEVDTLLSEEEKKRQREEHDRVVKDIENRVMRYGPYDRKERFLKLLDPRENYYTSQLQETMQRPKGLYNKPLYKGDPRATEPFTPPLYTHPLRAALYGANRLIHAWTGRDYYDEARKRFAREVDRQINFKDMKPVENKRGGSVKLPSRGDGIAQKGKTKGRYI